MGEEEVVHDFSLQNLKTVLKQSNCRPPAADQRTRGAAGGGQRIREWGMGRSGVGEGGFVGGAGCLGRVFDFCFTLSLFFGKHDFILRRKLALGPTLASRDRWREGCLASREYKIRAEAAA